MRMMLIDVKEGTMTGTDIKEGTVAGTLLRNKEVGLSFRMLHYEEGQDTARELHLR